jgi:uncharacterized protein (TIGR03083 family)
MARLREECSAVEEVVAGAPSLEAPTRLPGWRSRHVLAHLYRDFERLGLACRSPLPGVPTADALSYWQSYDRSENAVRTTSRAEAIIASFVTDGGLVEGWRTMWRESVDAASAIAPDMVVATRGPPMRVLDFAATRLVEVVVHGLDTTAALRRAPVVGTEAAGYVAALLEALSPVVGLRLPHWDDVAWIERATGRAELTPDESAALGPSADAFPLLA